MKVEHLKYRIEIGKADHVLEYKDVQMDFSADIAGPPIELRFIGNAKKKELEYQKEEQESGGIAFEFAAMEHKDPAFDLAGIPTQPPHIIGLATKLEVKLIGKREGDGDKVAVEAEFTMSLRPVFAVVTKDPPDDHVPINPDDYKKPPRDGGAAGVPIPVEKFRPPMPPTHDDHAETPIHTVPPHHPHPIAHTADLGHFPEGTSHASTVGFDVGVTAGGAVLGGAEAAFAFGVIGAEAGACTVAVVAAPAVAIVGAGALLGGVLTYGGLSLWHWMSGR